MSFRKRETHAITTTTSTTYANFEGERERNTMWDMQWFKKKFSQLASICFDIFFIIFFCFFFICFCLYLSLSLLCWMSFMRSTLPPSFRWSCCVNWLLIKWWQDGTGEKKNVFLGYKILTFTFNVFWNFKFLINFQ